MVTSELVLLLANTSFTLLEMLTFKLPPLETSPPTAPSVDPATELYENSRGSVTFVSQNSSGSIALNARRLRCRRVSDDLQLILSLVI